MKKTTSKDNIQKAQRLLVLNQQLKELEREAEDLKSHFKDLIGEDSSIQAGDVTVMVSERTRTNFDAKALTEDKGVEFVAKYQNTTIFKVVSVSGKFSK